MVKNLSLFLKLHAEKKLDSEIAKELGNTTREIRAAREKLNLKRNCRTLTKELLDIIYKEYLIYGGKHITVKYGIGASALKRKGYNTQNISEAALAKSKKIYSSFKNTFKEVDSSEKAYILGLLYSDGNLNKKAGCSITLHKNDTYLLEGIKQYIGGNAVIYFPKNKNVSVLGMFNYLFIEDLIKLGLSDNKNKKVLKFPNISAEFIPSFILGFLDGDGGYTHYKRNGKINSFCIFFSSVHSDFLTYIKEYLAKFEINAGISLVRKAGSSYKIHNVDGKTTRDSYSLRITSKKSVCNFYNLVYNNSFCLLRKKALIDNYVNTVLTANQQ